MFHIKVTLLLMDIRQIILLTLLVILSLASTSQNVLLKQDVLADTASSNNGPNKANYFHTYFSYGLPVAENFTGADIIIGRSANFNFGLRYKRKISNFYALGLELFYEGNEFNLKQNNDKILLDTTQHDRERLRFNQFGIGFYNRFNFGRRGDAIGNFIDIGAYGEWVFNMTHVTKDEMPDGSKVKVKTRKLGYEEPLAYGVLVRIGFNRFVLFGKYRLSDFLKEKHGYPELPHINTGIQIGFH